MSIDARDNELDELPGFSSVMESESEGVDSPATAASVDDSAFVPPQSPLGSLILLVGTVLGVRGAPSINLVRGQGRGGGGVRGRLLLAPEGIGCLSLWRPLLLGGCLRASLFLSSSLCLSWQSFLSSLSSGLL